MIWYLDIIPFQLELILNKADGGDISTYVPNGEWDLIGILLYSPLDVSVKLSLSIFKLT